jgi:Calcineurin-like phosphoesterase
MSSSAGPPSPDSIVQTDRAALPIARRLARAVERAGRGRFPLHWRPHRSVERLPMVGWYEPRQLLDTGLKTLFSMIVGARSDPRIVQALGARKLEYYDYTFHYRDGRDGPYVDRTHAREEIWIDYVSDTGDGWNSTYAIAYALAQPELDIRDSSDVRCRVPRADVLVFGGDQVYPTPSREAYSRRLVTPYETAFGETRVEESPHVFAIPGNHDWYDGLTAFARLFCSEFGGRYFGGWRTRQQRSYFALKLPGRWWLIGSDGQLQADIDTPQIEYFRYVADRHMQPGDRAIVCLAAPVWIHAHKYRQYGGSFDETDLLYLRDEIFARRGVQMKVFLAGDNHHYRRHEEMAPLEPGSPIQKITAGGGGGFLNATHDEDVTTLEEERAGTDEPRRRFTLKATYPDVRQSHRLSYGNLLFVFKNPRFGVVPALIYLMTVWMVSATIVHPRPTSLFEALAITVQAWNRNPSLTLWALFVTAIFVVFTDTHSRLYRWLGGLAHAAAHWSAMFAVGWAAMLAARSVSPAWPPLRFFIVGVLVGAGGWILGSVLMGLYLLISLNVFGRHSQQAFAALRIEDFKHFLRLHIGADGALTIYPIRIDRVPRRWREPDETSGGSPSRLVPETPLEPALIEPPIVVR